MKKENIDITACKLGKKTKTMSYYNKLDQMNYKIEDVEYAHPDLQKAAEGLIRHFAKAFYIEGEERDHFVVDGFKLDTKDKHETVKISGSMTNDYGYVTPVNSGHIPLDETQDDLKADIETLGLEMFKYFFEGKSAQGKIDGFPANASEEQAQKEEKASEETSDSSPEDILDKIESN